MRTRLARAFAAAALSVSLLLGLPAALPAAAASQVSATEGLNVRSGPSTKSKIIGSLSPGQTVTAVSTTKGWTKIKYGKATAYAASKYLRKANSLPSVLRVSPGSVRISTTAINLRRGPGSIYAVIKIFKKGTRLTVTGKTGNGYIQVINGTSTGYVSALYLTGPARGLPGIIGTRIATTALDIRTTSGSDYKTIAEVKKGTKLSVTGASNLGRAQVVYKGVVRWVTAKYLANPATNKPAVPTLPKVTGTRYATATLDVRSTSANAYTLIAEVARGTKLSITGVVKNGRMQIVYNSAARWVTARYLSKSKPAVSSGNSKAEKGLKPNAVKVHRAVRARFPQIKTIYTIRPDSIPDHPSGRALDLMIPNYKSKSGRALGFEVAAWAKNNARSLGINYIIWDQHIWNIQRDREGWRYMANRGGDSANHKNHVHITVYG